MKCHVRVEPPLQNKASYVFQLLLDGPGYKFEPVDAVEDAQITYSFEAPPDQVLWIRRMAGSDWDITNLNVAFDAEIPIFSQKTNQVSFMKRAFPSTVYYGYTYVSVSIERDLREHLWGPPMLKYLKEAFLMNLEFSISRLSTARSAPTMVPGEKKKMALETFFAVYSSSMSKNNYLHSPSEMYISNHYD